MKKIFILIAFLLSTYYLLDSDFVFAQNRQPPANQGPGTTKLVVPIPVPTSGGVQTVTEITGLGQYIQTVYRFSLGIGGLFAMLFTVYGGILYTVSAGNPSKQSEAKDIITNAVWGLVLLLGAFLILNTINPKLISSTITQPTAPALPASQQPAQLSQAARQQQIINAAGQSSIAAGQTFEQIAQDWQTTISELGLSGTNAPDPSKWTGWNSLTAQDQARMAYLNTRYFAASSDSIRNDFEFVQATANNAFTGLATSEINQAIQLAKDNNCTGAGFININTACRAYQNLISWGNLYSRSVINANIAQTAAARYAQ